MNKMLTVNTICLLIILIFGVSAGCQDGQVSEKQMRLVAVENEQLQQQLNQCRKESNEKLALKESKIRSLEAEKEQLSKQLSGELEEMMSNFVGMLAEENEKLKAENQQLKEKIEEFEQVKEQ